MGSVLSYSTEDDDGDEDKSISSYTELIQSSFLPLDQKVKVHLVPKFYASDDGGGYFLLVTLRKTTNIFSNSAEDSSFTANVEFHQDNALVSAREFFGLPPSCSTVTTVEDSRIEVREVVVKTGESIRICGVFNNGSARARSLVELEHDSFDLILCPSDKITPQPGEWILLGTLYTKPVKLKRERQWKAAVRKDFN